MTNMTIFTDDTYLDTSIYFLIFGNIELLHGELLPNITHNIWITHCMCVRVSVFASLSLFKGFGILYLYSERKRSIP